MKVILFTAMGLFMFGCVAPKLSPEGQKVKLVETKLLDAKKCKKGQPLVHVNGVKYGGAVSKMVIADIKNLVGQNGHNVGVTDFNFNVQTDYQTGHNVIPLNSRIVVEQYDCPADVWTALQSM